MVLQAKKNKLLDEVLKEIDERKGEFKKKKYVPQDMIKKLKEIGVYRAHAPKRFGGDGLSPMEFLELIETISRVDGSTGWVASFGSAAIYIAALPIDTLEKVYADGPDVAFAGGLFPVQKAEKVAGGYNVDGVWKFASGCKGADILGVGIGASEDGKPLTAVFQQGEIEIIKNWDVFGMVGTGSFDLKVDNQFVPEEWTFVRGGEASIDEPIFRYPTIAYAAQVLAVVNLGIARAALDEIRDIAMARGGYTGAPRLADRSYLRISLAKAEANLRSARAFFYEATEKVWEKILKGDELTDDDKSMLRLSSAQATRESARAVQEAYMLAGIPAIYKGHVLQDHLCDAMVVTQHAFLNESMYEGAGNVFVDLPTIPGYI